jgi:long-chain acyl-CoA synthetase
MEVSSLGHLILERAARSPTSVAFRVRRADRYEDITWCEVRPRLDAIAAGLLSVHDLADDAHITIMGNTSMEWVLCDFAAMTIGLRTVPVYASLLAEEVGYVHADTDAVVTICEDGGQLAKVRAIRDGFEFFGQRYTKQDVKIVHIVVIDPTGIAPATDWESLTELEARGTAKLQELRLELERRRRKIVRTDTATYTYTSGTTGPPKAVIQTHDNMLSIQEMTERAGIFSSAAREGGLFLFLPLAHSFGRLIEHACPYFNAPLVISSIPTLVDDLLLSKPGVFPSAPRVYEKMKARIEGAVAGAPSLRRQLFHWALHIGRRTIPYRAKGRPLPLLLSTQYRIADRLVLSKLRERLGFDNLGLALSGAAPLSIDVHEFFLAIGTMLVEGYGLTETCPALSINRPGDFKIGTVGKALDEVQLEIARDGEILARGPNISSGYLNRDDATRNAFDEAGWFHTGDLGSLDEEGFLTITGRKKELIKTSGGKYVAPVKIEALLKSHTIVQEAVVVGDKRHFCVALISLDPEELATWASRRGVEPNAFSASVREELGEHIEQVNAKLATFERIKYFETLDGPMTVDNGLLTASLKVKRRFVEERFADLIEQMYRGRTSIT